MMGARRTAAYLVPTPQTEPPSRPRFMGLAKSPLTYRSWTPSRDTDLTWNYKCTFKSKHYGIGIKEKKSGAFVYHPVSQKKPH